MITLQKSLDNKIIAGVCGGLSDAFGISLNIVRLVFFISVFFGGAGLIAYLILMFVLPEAGYSKSEHNEIHTGKKLLRLWNSRKIAGVCAGLAKYFNLDLGVVRMVFLLSVFIGGFGVYIYIILWFILASED